MQATAPNAAYALENTHLSQKTRLVHIMEHINKDCQNSVLHQHQFVFNFYHRAKCRIWSDQDQVPAWDLLSVGVIGHYASHAWIQDKHMHWHGKFTEDKWWNFFLTW